MLNVWNPMLRPTLSPSTLEREMARMFDPRATAAEVPADVYETEEALVLSLDVPGVTEKDLEVKFEHGVLSVRVDRKTPETAGRAYHLRERPATPVTRSFRLPRRADGSQAQARFEHGVLTVTVPFRVEDRGRTIEVHTA